MNMIIIGGGVSGSFAAIKLAEKNKPVTIIEKERSLLRKLGLTGKGRGNITNNSVSENHINNIFTNPRFMYSALNAFDCNDTIAFFEGLGVELKTERGGRVFPVSDNASELVIALKKRIEQLKIPVVNGEVTEILIKDNAVYGVKLKSGEIFRDSTVLLSAGGKSYPKTGSDGSGYALAKHSGHTIVAPKPALVGLVTKEDVTSINGIELKNVSLTVKQGNETVFRKQGELKFESYGMRGALGLTASCCISSVDTADTTLLIDLKPALTPEQIDKRIMREIAETKTVTELAEKLMPRDFAEFFLQKSEVSEETKTAVLTAVQRKRIARTLKELRLTCTGTRSFDEAIITDGGVCVKEINPKTMESKLVKGLYFAGEIIDVAGLTGGYNLQIAFSTANAAVQSGI